MYNYFGDFLMKNKLIITTLIVFTSFYSLYIYSSKDNVIVEKANSNFIYPTNYTNISSTYGYRILYGSSNFHNGIDFLAPLGSEVYASNSGYVIYSSFLQSGYGNTIIVSHDNGYKTLYCHLSENFIVHNGEYVNKGEIIGYVGPRFLSNGVQNGNTTGPHLHFTVFVNNNTVDPMTILNRN